MMGTEWTWKPVRGVFLRGTGTGLRPPFDRLMAPSIVEGRTASGRGRPGWRPVAWDWLKPLSIVIDSGGCLSPFFEEPGQSPPACGSPSAGRRENRNYSFRSWFDRLTTNDESRDFWNTTLAYNKQAKASQKPAGGLVTIRPDGAKIAWSLLHLLRFLQ